MSFSRRTPQMLHEDHQATVIVIEGLDSLLAKSKRAMPNLADASVQTALKNATNAIAEEVSAHFTFEETELFTRLEDAGDVGIGAHLREEHAAILPLGLQVADLARTALETGFTEASWQEFRPRAAELIERMIAHIQKEEMALLPMLDELLDPETDMDLSTAYANSH